LLDLPLFEAVLVPQLVEDVLSEVDQPYSNRSTDRSSFVQRGRELEHQDDDKLRVVSILELRQEGAFPVESTTTDFRSDRMESAEGLGRARNAWKKAWDKYLETMDKHAGPVMEPYLKPIAARLEAGMLGFWLLWRLEGGFEGLERMGMARTTIYRKIKFFRTITGKHPDEYEIPGVRIDLDKFLGAGGFREGAPGR